MGLYLFPVSISSWQIVPSLDTEYAVESSGVRATAVTDFLKQSRYQPAPFDEGISALCDRKQSASSPVGLIKAPTRAGWPISRSVWDDQIFSYRTRLLSKCLSARMSQTSLAFKRGLARIGMRQEPCLHLQSLLAKLGGHTAWKYVPVLCAIQPSLCQESQ